MTLDSLVLFTLVILLREIDEEHARLGSEQGVVVKVLDLLDRPLVHAVANLVEGLGFRIEGSRFTLVSMPLRT